MPLRPLHQADSAAAAVLIRTVFAGIADRLDPKPSALNESEAAIRALLARGGGVCAEHDGALVACALWEEKSGGLYLGRVSVAPQARGKGLARAMIAAAEAEATRRGLPRLWLSTRLTLTENRRLFAACGFTETAQHAHPGYPHPTYVDMEKPLPPPTLP